MRMKKELFLVLILLVASISFSMTFAEGFGSIEKIEDRIVPEGENAIIYQSITAVTNDSGEVIFPFNKKNEIVDIEVAEGTMTVEPTIIEMGDTKYHTVTFEGSNQNVVFTVSMKQEGFYEGEEADLGDTFPKDVKEVGYKFLNNTPVEIQSYKMFIGVPEEMELLNIVDFKDSKPFSITKSDGRTFGGFDYGTLAVGKEAKLAVNLYKNNKTLSMVIIGLAFLISILFMYKNKHLLKSTK